MGLIAAGVVAAGAAVAGSVMSADASRHAANQAKDSQKYANDLNYQQFLQSRGSKGSSILPMYLANSNGQMFEGNVLGANAMQTYQDAYNQLTPDEQMAQMQAILGSYEPMIMGANQTAQGIFNGDIENQQLNAEQPVVTARQAGVTARKEATLESLADTLNQIDAVQAGKGYTGDSFGNRLLKATAMRSAATANATDQSNADLTSAQEIAGIKQGAINTRLGSLQLPYAMAQQSSNLMTLPQSSAMDQEARRQQLFSFFRIAPNQFTYQPLPVAPPNVGTAGAIVSGLGSGANSVANYLANKQLANSLSTNGGAQTNGAIQEMGMPAGGYSAGYGNFSNPTFSPITTSTPAASAQDLGAGATGAADLGDASAAAGLA